ncbi:hypothetical protein IF188_19295 [Microbacterium sp. NEAU-LLC]|uniref:Uncharacterized protein n=1 Tax=Microbacterium helvum TaxID=2773713 RepID=A0ABR8NUX2_9MICO|nr:hypothetical protein [Microbacterium helvum]MBD3943843.1 hypothetical protein [Microbacterium helvum]
MTDAAKPGSNTLARTIGAEAVWVAIIAVAVLGIVFVVMMMTIKSADIPGAYGVFAWDDWFAAFDERGLEFVFSQMPRPDGSASNEFHLEPAHSTGR